MSLLDIRDLGVTYRTRRGTDHRAVDGVSLTVAAGEVVAIVGETGSGKTTTASAVIGLLAHNATVDSGEILLNGVDVRGWSSKRLETVRGTQVGLIPQDPGSSLDPLKTVGWQIGETLRIHGERDRDVVAARVAELLRRVDLPDVERITRAYPHELSGGMRQRVLIASALALQPSLLIADEPTSALDVTVQRRILDLLDELRREDGSGILFVTHDLGAAAERADRILVMKDGRIEDSGPVAEVLGNPTSEYTKRLLRNAPALGPVTFRPPPRPAGPGAAVEPAIEVRDLRKVFAGRGSRGADVAALDGVGFTVAPGTTHAVVGESGSGKSTTARILLGFETPTSGTALVTGTDVAALSREARRQFRRHIQLVHQNPFSSLDPKLPVLEIVAEPLRNFRLGDRRSRRATATALLDRVALGAEVHGRRPAELSGGQRQRVAIARALVLEPSVVVLDEPVSALDVSVQAQILDLLAELQRELALTYLFISHDLDVVRQVSDTVTVMSRGRVEETATTEQIFRSPRSEYTRDLLDAIARPRLEHPIPAP
ncbi:ABC transporter ATP-binding protein [Georgenia sunbinii]|uniref:ABC transporter ATP-binding protein n=1 Tax=Georgenia sunbinii TaxID=3117728 RepID=UPI002F26D265